MKKAEEMGIPMSIAVMDEGANLLGFARSDQGKLHNIGIAMAKARAAASNRRPTGKIGTMGNPIDDHMAIALPLAAGPENYVTFSGGLPILVDGHCVGGVGTSGGMGNRTWPWPRPAWMRWEPERPRCEYARGMRCRCASTYSRL